MQSVRRAPDLFALSVASNDDIEETGERTPSTADLDRLILRLVRVFEPSVFIEVGALDAGISRRVRRILPEARIGAFEASPVNHEKYARGSRARHTWGFLPIDPMCQAVPGSTVGSAARVRGMGLSPALGRRTPRAARSIRSRRTTR